MFPLFREIVPYMETPLGLSPRLMSAKIHTKNGYVNFLSVYAPTRQSKDEDKDRVFNRLEEEGKFQGESPY